MTLHVDPEAVRAYATHLLGLQQAAQKAKLYVNTYGSLSVHEQGLIGKLAGYHDTYVADLNDMLDKLSRLLESSSDALKKSASSYQDTDRDSADRMDATLPPSRRATPSRD